MPVKTVSQLVESQLPAFVRDDYPLFADFLRAYYEWLENNGTDVYTGKLFGSSNVTVTLGTDASTRINDYLGMTIVVLNGPAKGQRGVITAYDPSSQLATIQTGWGAIIPPVNSRIVIRDTIYPDKLFQYKDIDTTLDKFVNFFRDEFLYQIPGTILADKRNVLKHIKEFYRSRGTENSFRFLFRIMFNDDVDFYYPKVDLFKLSAGTDSFTSSTKILQDSYYWQDFSYDLKVADSISQYRKVFQTLLHPAGMKMFGSVVSTSVPATKFLELIREFELKLDSQTFDTSLSVAFSSEVIVNTDSSLSQPPVVIGSRRRDFERFKFTGFPPDATFSLVYPFPNQNYWTPNGPGNTQIGNLASLTVEYFMANPDVRLTISPDTYLSVSQLTGSTLVGPIGQSRAAITQSCFTGFPPFQGFNEVYPSPNQNYWDSTAFGNTQLSVFANILISDLVISPTSLRSNYCVDSQLTIMDANTIPVIGSLCEYDFLEGMNPQIVYNVSPNMTGKEGLYDAVLGGSILTGGDDGSWDSFGVALSSGQIVTATGIPVNMGEYSIAVVAMTTSTSVPVSIVNCVQSSPNGYSIDITAGGGLSFRLRVNSVNYSVAFAPGTVVADTYFMATLRFASGTLSGTINTNTQTITFSYPAVPPVSTEGFVFGLPSASYPVILQAPALYGSALFGTAEYDQAATEGTPVSLDPFVGTLAYALFYDRSLLDFEVDAIYNYLKASLAERDIVLP